MGLFSVNVSKSPIVNILSEFDSKLDFLKEQKEKDYHVIAISWLLSIN